jgi:1-acyl-sn-glycerol-3-phosphate acyltransferase
VIGRITSGFLPVSPAPAPELKINWNPFSETWRNLKLANEKRAVFNSILGISWLWFFGSVFLTLFAGFSKEVLGGDERVVSVLLTVFSVGIATGALLCERLSGRKVEIGLVPFGSIGMTVFAVDLYFASRGMQPTALVDIADFLAQQGTWRILADLFFLALFSGLYSVPLYALIQTRTEESHRSRIIASNNILNALFMVVASLMLTGLFAMGFAIPQVFLVTALLNAAVAIYIYSLVPEFLMRFICWLLIHTVYRLEKKGIENIPAEGPAVLVCNHVSFVDALVIMAASPRPIRFVMDYHIFKVPVMSFIFRSTKAIPIASARDNEALLNQAFDQIAIALAEGDLVAIFPEGRITDNGEIYPFKNGIKRIIERSPVPVIPMALRGLWGSFFSRKYGSAMTKPFRRGLFPRISLIIGAAWPAAETTPEKLQLEIEKMRGNWR